MPVDLSQFASLFEIGFAVHIAVAFLERIYARELPVRLERIAGRINALERFKQEVLKASMRWQDEQRDSILPLASGDQRNPVWVKRNDDLLEHLHVLKHDSTHRLDALRAVLALLMILSILVALYSVTMLFLVGLQVEAVTALEPLRASLLVLAQLLPLPLAAALFYFFAHRMSLQVDRKLRGVGELRVTIGRADDPGQIRYLTIEEIYHRDVSGMPAVIR